MSSPTKKTDKGIPVGRLLAVLSVVGVIGLATYGAWGLFGMVRLTDFPITGEWQAKGKPWRIDFRADKTVSSTDSSQPGASQAPASESGTYKVDYFGNLWVMLKNGRTFTATLTPPPEAASTAPAPVDRFDLIESGTESVTMFEKVQSQQTTSPDTPRKSQVP